MTQFPYDDLDREATRLLDRMVARIEEKDAEHEPAAWRGTVPDGHIHKATSHLNEAKYRTCAAGHRDLERARTEIADAVNHLLMALVNHPHANPPEARDDSGIDDPGYEWETDYRDAAEVMQRLGLAAEPAAVEMTGRNVGFKYPVPVEGEDDA